MLFGHNASAADDSLMVLVVRLVRAERGSTNVEVDRTGTLAARDGRISTLAANERGADWVWRGALVEELTQVDVRDGTA